MAGNNQRIPKFSIGIDMEMIERFEKLSPELHKRQLNRIFTPNELNFCFSKIDPAPCLCGRFCAKEAIIKAFSSIDNSLITFTDIEIIKKDEKGPTAHIIGKQFSPDFLEKIEIKVSISHTAQAAVSNALIIYWCDL
ncbi:MAG TPA: holo-ACP synthase [Methanospirillum sp.]|jgi:holo-[acyl-carrier protein] synthase|uniref:holo-ACP synthase n=1 Tax=Methanospirillum sp. TaxID=45200 RepID=UPI002C1080AA|nr:holo-ACP synthase [Methanospirillum sp.]HPY59600.1 holo-ACP synthase [Methanospirillum sp.]